MIRLNTSQAYQAYQGAEMSSASTRSRSSNRGKIEHGDALGVGRRTNPDAAVASMEAAARKTRLGQRRNEELPNDDVKRVLGTLPRDSQGRVSPESLVDESKKTSLTEAVERLVLEGLGTGADIAFEKAVHSLFAEYADDLGLDDAEIRKARDLMLSEVREVIADNRIRPWSPHEPAPAMANIDDAIEKLQQMVQDRRQTILEASGDLSRVLAELTVEAENGGDAESEALGGFVKRMSLAIENRSTFGLKKAARERLLATDVMAPTHPGSQDLGDAFLSGLRAG